ncbi:MAG: hypothetical protein H7259_01845 [Cytophagales bacterium]|nr:hypothetical protein [Cytophaga sp.]
MLVDLYYEISPGFQGIFVYIRAYLTITLWDKNGNRVFAIREMAKSTKTTPALDDIPVMTAATIQPLCENATDILFSELKGKLTKMVKKSPTF